VKLPLLRANPFPVEAWFKRSCALTFAVPRTEVAARLPAGLVPDTFADRWGFVAVAVVQTQQLRPAGFPRFLGQDFVLVGYRFFVRCTLASGRTLRGLYILRSETDRPRMEWLGNLFTRYRYVTTPLRVEERPPRFTIAEVCGGLRIAVDLSVEPPPSLPDGSPFADWREARRFCGPMPFTFAVEEARHEVRIVEGLRSGWVPRPVRVLEQRVPYLDLLGFPDAILANAFVVESIPYRWERGRSEALPPL
jgi:hypothetical protein